MVINYRNKNRCARLREAYTDKEVSVTALRPLLDTLHDADALAYVDQIIPADATRVSWDVMCDLLDFAVSSAEDARGIGAEAIKSSAYKYRGRLRFVSRILGLEQIVRFMIFPRNPIDFSCISHTVSAAPGRVDLLLYINLRYRPHPMFFAILHGAAQEFVKQLDLPGGEVTMTTHGAQAHLALNFCEAKGFIHDVHTTCSRLLGNFLLRRLAIRSYPDLVAGRKMFEEQLIERTKLEDKLRTAQRDFDSRMSQVDEIIADIDESGNLVYVSPNAKRLINLPDTASPQDFSRIVHPEDLARVTNSIKEALQHPDDTRVDDFRIIDAKGSLRWVEIDLRHSEHSPGRLIAVGRDISGRRQRQHDQMTIERQLEQTQRKEVLGVLSGGIAHQFNNLLVPIVGEAELAESELDRNSKVQDRLDRIRLAAGKAADLVRQISVFAGGNPSTSSVVDLSDQARELPELASSDISPVTKLTLQLDSDALVEGNAAQLQQAMMNLVINAAEAIGDNPGTIRLSVSAHDKLVDFVVSDNGPGMDEWTKTRAVEPFYTTKFAGRGLGLAAAMGIARTHEGELFVESNLGEGTQVTMRLPRVSNKAVDSTVDYIAQFTGLALVADDDEAVLAVGKALMEKLGFDVDTATDGTQALELFSKKPYSVVLVDLVMPKLDGREVLAAIRKQTPSQPVVIISGYGNSSLRTGLASDPATRFLSKPYKLNQLGKTLWSLNDLISPAETSKKLSR